MTKLEIHLRSLESLQQDTNHDIFVFIIASKIPKDVLLQLALQKGAREKWEANTLRKSFNNYICATEWAEQMSCLKKPEQNPQTHTNGFDHRLILHCKFCIGNHWSDQCVEYPTSEDRKRKIQDSCYLCLKIGHKAHNCRLNKACYYCTRINHNHRSLCPQKYGAKSVNGETIPIEECAMCQAIRKENQGKGNALKQEQNQMTDNQKKHSVKPTTWHKDQSNKSTDMVSEDSYNRKEIVLERVYDDLTKEKENLQAMNAELNERLVDVSEKLLKSQLENIDLETQLKDIATSLTNQTKVSDKAMQSGRVTSFCNFELAKVKMDRKEMEIHALMKEECQAMRSKVEDETEFDACIENTLEFKENVATYLKSNIHQHWHMDKFLWPRECRGNPTIIL